MGTRSAASPSAASASSFPPDTARSSATWGKPASPPSCHTGRSTPSTAPAWPTWSVMAKRNSMRYTGVSRPSPVLLFVTHAVLCTSCLCTFYPSVFFCFCVVVFASIVCWYFIFRLMSCPPILPSPRHVCPCALFFSASPNH